MSTTTSNMSLLQPSVGVDSGPQWATDLNTSIGLIDTHNHASGNGVQINVGGINIDADLEMNANDLTEVRTVRMENQAAALTASTDKRCIYNVAGDLYYNNEDGTAIQITDAAIIANSISGMTGTNASVTYNDTTKRFTFLQDTNETAALSCEDILIHADGAATNFSTLQYTGSSDIVTTIPELTATLAHLGAAAQTFAGITTFSDATNSTSTTAGAVKLSAGGLSIAEATDATNADNGGSFTTAGGIAVKKKAYVGTDLDVGNDLAVGNDFAVTGNVTGTVTLTGDIVGTTGTTITGGIASGDDLTLNSTTHGTKGNILITESTTSTSTSTGALVVTGGVGIGENLWAAGTGDFGGAVDITGAITLTGDITGDSGTIITGGTSIGNDLTLRSTSNGTKGSVIIDENTAATTKTSGALVVTGGVGVGGRVDAGALYSEGACQFDTTLSVAGITNITDATASTDKDTGCLVLGGGLGVESDVFIGNSLNATGQTKLNAVTDSSSISTGGVVTSGGVGIAKKLYVGTDLDVGGNFTVTGSMPSSSPPYAHATHTLATSNHGGTFTAGAWQIRSLTAISTNITGCSLATNQITLPTGTYMLHAFACCYKVGANGLRWWNDSDSTEDLLGQPTVTGTGVDVGVIATINGVFTIAAEKNFELQHYGASTGTTTGFGVDGNHGSSNTFVSVIIYEL